MEKIIHERYTQDQLDEFNTLLESLITNNFVLFVGAKLTNIIEEMMWFFNKVTHQGPWDLKVDKSWDETIGISPRLFLDYLVEMNISFFMEN